MVSKNDLFNTDWSVRPPPSLPTRIAITPRPPPPPSPKPPDTTTTPCSSSPSEEPEHIATAATSSSTQQNDVSGPTSVLLEPTISARSSSLATIRPSEAIEVKLFMESQLGHGRHATVHVGLYSDNAQRSTDSQSEERRDSTGRLNGSSSPAASSQVNHTVSWKLCAVKRFDAGKEAQVACLSEALMLSKLSKCEHVLHYIALKDEGSSSSRRPSSSSRASTGLPDHTMADEQRETISASTDNNGPGTQIENLAIGSSSLRAALEPPLLAHPQSPPPLNGYRSTPSSPLLKPSKPNKAAATIPPGFSIQALSSQNQKSNDAGNDGSNQGANLRRGATMKAPYKHSHLAPRDTKLTVSNLRIETDDPPRMLLLSELCILGNLASFVREYGQDYLGKRMFFKFAIDLMSALVATHAKNIIHGDVKPQNCLLTDKLELKLGDYSSSIFNSPDLIDGIGLGTTQYSCPEIVQVPPSPFSFPIDVFAAGLTLLFMITGVEPYESLMAASSHRSNRLTPLSPRSVSSRNASGSVTPTHTSRRKLRTSSGAGKMVELHLHLSKGHAWEWEERRRYEEIEDSLYHETDYHDQNEYQTPPSVDAIIDVRDLGMCDAGTLAQLPSSVIIPAHLIDDCNQIPLSQASFYGDGHTPVQAYLSGKVMVSEDLRQLIEQMLRPIASQRPTAAEVLDSLSAMASQ